MKEFLEKLFTSDFMPHGYCYLWKPGLVWLHVLSDALIALAYFSIPVTLVYFIRKRRDLPFHWMFVSFGIFILACGTTHIMEVWTLWHATYWLSGGIKVVTAMASVPTAILLVQLVPQMLELPSPKHLRLEIAERKRAEEALYQANTQLKKAEEMFRRVVETAPDAIVLVNPEGRIVMTNPRAEEIFRWAQQELIDQPFEILVPNRFRNGLADNRSAYLRMLQHRLDGQDQELYLARRDGSELPVEIGPSTIETVDTTLVSFTIRDITERKRLEERARQSTILEERGRMAQDVHDTIAQGFTGIVLNLEAAEQASVDLPKEVRHRIGRARDVARQNLEEMRRSVLTLSCSCSLRGDLPGAIQESVEAIRSNTGAHVDFALRGTPQRLNARFEENLLRIAQQGLDNALQHAQARAIRIGLVFGEKEIQLRIGDNGRGFVTSKLLACRMGINGMRKRAKEIGGKFELRSQPGRGTRVTVKVPLLGEARLEARHEEEVRSL